MMDATPLEHALAQIVRHLRDEAETRAAKLERRLDVLEQRAGDSIAAKLYRGESVDSEQWLAFVRRIQPREIGTWRPEHASWHGGHHGGDRRS